MSEDNITILLNDENYVFVNKPSGLLTIPDRHDNTVPSVLTSLKKKFETIFIVHRIDKDTSGTLVFAHHAEAHRHASMAFENRQVTKKYVGIVHGSPFDKQGTIADKIMDHPTIKGKMIVNAKQGKEAITNYKVLESFGGYTLIEFHILTGRMHQIRIHAANMGCPLLCDPIYGKDEQISVSNFNRKYKLGKHIENEMPILSRLALHSNSISFEHLDGKNYSIEAPLYKDMKATLQQMRKWIKQ